MPFFYSTDLRPDATKVLVVIIDKKSDNTIEEVREAAVLLENYNIRVIPVALGREAGIQELTNITLDKNDLVKTDNKGDPEKTAEEIIMKASKFSLSVYNSVKGLNSGVTVDRVV